MFTRLVRTSSVRLALAYAAITATTFLALFAAVYVVATNALDHQIRLGIEAEFQNILAEAKEATRSELAQEIHERATVNGLSFLYFLQDGSGQRLAGNINDVKSTPGWQNLAFPNPQAEDRDHELLLLGGYLPDGSFLAVGDDLQPTLAAREAIVTSFAWASVLALALSIIPGLFVGRRFLKRIDTISGTSNEIMSGRLKERIPVRGSGDEFDHLAENLNRMLDRIESLLENLKQLSGNIAHDLRTPLSRLHQTLEEARSRVTEPRGLEKALDQAIADSRVLQATFDALLRISEIESKSRRAAFRPMSLSALLENIVEVYTPVVEGENKTLTSAIAEGLKISGDEELMIQMIANLLENAIKHTPPGASLQVSLKKDDKRLVAEIADDGDGIPEEERHRVFERFYRLERSRTTPGNGLGLALVAAIADLHGAFIALEDNKPGLRVRLSF